MDHSITTAPISVSIGFLSLPGVGRSSLLFRYSSPMANLSQKHPQVIRRVSVSHFDVHVDIMPFLTSELQSSSFNIVCACYSIGHRKSFDGLPSLLGDDNTPRVLIGCQGDLRSAPGVHCVSSREGLWMMEAIGAVGFVETSAETNCNVRLLFDYLARLYIGKVQSHFVSLFTPDEFAFYDESPVFQEFCRLFGPALRKRIPGAKPVDIVTALKRMFTAAPIELKLHLKKSLLPARFFVSQDILIPFELAEGGK
jgi:hypothetical protein